MSHIDCIVKNIKTERISYNKSGSVSSYTDAATNNLIISNLNPGGKITIVADTIDFKPKNKLLLSTGNSDYGNTGAILTGYGDSGCKWTPYSTIPEIQAEKKNVDALIKELTSMKERIAELEKKINEFCDFEIIDT